MVANLCLCDVLHHIGVTNRNDCLIIMSTSIGRYIDHRIGITSMDMCHSQLNNNTVYCLVVLRVDGTIIESRYTSESIDCLLSIHSHSTTTRVHFLQLLQPPLSEREKSSVLHR